MVIIIFNMSSAALVINHADQIERCLHSRAVWSLHIGECTLEQRRLLLDHHGKVMALLRKRGWHVTSTVVHDEMLDGELITVRLQDQQTWSLPEQF